MLNSISAFLMVFLGGGLGSVFRYGIARWLAPMNYIFPYATLLANIISCIILGFLVAINEQLPPAIRLLLLVGFCGGFSTFSTFSNETFQLFEQQNYAYAIWNIAGSIIICLTAIYCGLMLGKLMR